MKRLIGEYTGNQKGILVIALGATHGNEEAGVLALTTLFKMLNDEPLKNPSFEFKGKIIGFIGNLQAYEKHVRFIKNDLNRLFSTDYILKLKNNTSPQLEKVFEDLELLELIEFINNVITKYNPTQLIVLDLHTTSAEGGIFSIVSEDEESIRIASQLYAPVVKGLVKGLGGTTLHYFNTINVGIPTVAVSFEAGQHDDPKSVQRAIAWLVNCLREVGCVKADDVENRHDEILRGYSQNLPKVVELIDSHQITPDDNFEMMPGFKNFQPVKKGELLAKDKNGAIYAPLDCMILMPLYQKQGSDGFFLVKKIE
jgi:succinylglutamate desuccinylase